MSGVAAFLKDVYLFKSLNDADLKWIADNTTQRGFVGGDTVFREGDIASSLVIVRSGSVQITKRTSGGSQKLSMLGPKALLGEIGFVEKEPRSTTAEATESVEILELPYALFEQKIAKDPTFGCKIYHAMAHELVKTVRRTTSDLTALRELKLARRD